MTFVVTEACIRCKYTHCAEVCPVECFHEGPNFVVIDPQECIDCSLCELECPVSAIKSEDDLAEEDKKFLDINAKYAKKWPVISETKDPMPDADEWGKVKDKLQYLETGEGGEKPQD